MSDPVQAGRADTSLPARVVATLQSALAAHIADLYDDPADLLDESWDVAGSHLEALADAARCLGFDMWDPAAVEEHCGRPVHAHEIARLKALADADAGRGTS